ncbi:hypothetical protein D5086_015477 [Populus alba]|uniref:F-box family protein n=2 Tax=Populus alba TaxID=43335 RepID=A0A4U5MBH0_POPAL|nr:F-box family protein [Populus alba]
MDRKVAEEVKRDRIPEHVVTKILLKSPIKSILRFRRLILWNPSIKETLRLPPPRSFASTAPTLLGLDYDPRSDDYKVPRIVRLGNSAEHPFVFQFFSLNSGSWNENVDFFSSSLEKKKMRCAASPFIAMIIRL